MPEPTIEELGKSIQELSTYRDRLAQEVRSISQKLQIPEKRIQTTLKEHSELNQINNVLMKLKNQLADIKN